MCTGSIQHACILGGLLLKSGNAAAAKEDRGSQEVEETQRSLELATSSVHGSAGPRRNEMDDSWNRH